MPRAQRIRLSDSQNFLRDPSLVDALLDDSSIQAGDLVYEIGPGTGIITGRLAGRCRHVVAVERDPYLAAYLHARFRGYPNISIHTADFLRFPLPSAPYKVFASIPYGATAAIVTKLTAATMAPCDSYLIMQQEAADRFTGSPRATLYASLLHPWFEVSVVHRFRPTDFRPVPRVESALLRLRRRRDPLVAASDAQFFRDFVTFAFMAPRPALQCTFRACLGRRQADRFWCQEGLDPSVAPSMVPGTLWLLLFEHLKDAGGWQARHAVAGAAERLRLQQSGLQKRHRTQSASSAAPRPPC
jgi:23S rRNA (adenine-N6)-dimethyltransferase